MTIELNDGIWESTVTFGFNDDVSESAMTFEFKDDVSRVNDINITFHRKYKLCNVNIVYKNHEAQNI